MSKIGQLFCRHWAIRETSTKWNINVGVRYFKCMRCGRQWSLWDGKPHTTTVKFVNTPPKEDK